MAYPTSWRIPRPSQMGSRAATAGYGGSIALPGRGVWYLPRPSGPRIPRFGLLALGLLALDALTFRQPELGEGDHTMPLPNLEGYQHICGPFPHPGPPYDTNIFWRISNVYGAVCAEPIAGQAIASPNDTPTASTQTIIFYYGYNTALLPLQRYYGYDRYARSVAGALVPPIAVRPVAPLEALLLSGAGVISTAPTTPVAVVPLPVSLTPAIPFPTFPEESSRGYYPPLVGVANLGGRVAHVEQPPDRNVRYVPIAPVDVRAPPWMVEKKYSSTSRVGQMFTTWFKTLSFWGAANSSVEALWRALPRHARTRNARTRQKYKDLFYGFSELDLGPAFTNAVGYWVQYRLAGVLFGTAQRALTGVAGEAAGFGLYRAWATGEHAYRTTPGRFNPVRAPPGLEFHYAYGQSPSMGFQRGFTRPQSAHRRMRLAYRTFGPNSRHPNRAAFNRALPRRYRHLRKSARQWR